MANLLYNDYVIPTECDECGGHNFVLRVIVKDSGWSMIRCSCIACGWSVDVPKLTNTLKRTNTSLSHWAIQTIKHDMACKICGSTEDLEAHHIIPVSHSKAYKNWPSNGITLCKKCHWLVHNKEIRNG